MQSASSSHGNSLERRGGVLVAFLSDDADAERVVDEFRDRGDFHFLFVNPASGAPSKGNLTILRHPSIRGYGARQKAAYQFAVDGAFEWVVVAAGDRCSSLILSQLCDEVRRADADLSLAMSSQNGGAGFLTRSFVQQMNRLTALQLREYRSSPRAYSTRFLRRVPFQICSNDRRIDTEMLLQAIHVDAKIVEVETDVPAAHRSVGEWLQMFAAAARFRLQKMGMLCDLKYRVSTPRRYTDKSYMLYSSHAMALDLIRQLKPATLLDLGCGPGFIARRCEQMGVRVTAIDSHVPEDGIAGDFHKVDLEQEELPVDPFGFDCVLMLDVIEHIAEPEAFLIGLREQSESLVCHTDAPVLVLSTPNVAFAGIRCNLLMGRFSYGERGILDISHKRLFTRASLLRTLNDTGYIVESVQPVGVPVAAVVGGSLGRLLGKIAGILARLWPTMFAFQFLVTCRPTPGIRQVLKHSQQS